MERKRLGKKKTGVSQQNLQTDRTVKPWPLISHRIKWSLIHFPPLMSLPSDRSFCCAVLMFSILWQGAICHSNELLCGKKRSQGTFLKMSGSRECKVCNTVNSSGPGLQARGLPVYQSLTGTIHAKLRQGIENLGIGSEYCIGEPVFFTGENLMDSICSPLSFTSFGLSRGCTKEAAGRYIAYVALCIM